MGLVCRLVEERGIATVYFATGRDLAVLVKPPRTLFVNYPMGNNFGHPHNAEEQQHILRTGLNLLTTAQAGELVDYPGVWEESFRYAPGSAASG